MRALAASSRQIFFKLRFPAALPYLFTALMLEDGIFVKADWNSDPKNKQLAARFLRASLKGWELCKDTPAECVEIVLKESPVLAASIRPG